MRPENTNVVPDPHTGGVTASPVGSAVALALPAVMVPAHPWRTKARRWLTRYGTRPVLVVDAVVALAAVGLVVGSEPSGLLLAAVTIALYVSGGLYRSRLSLSVLDELPIIVGRGLVGAGLTVGALLAVHPRAPSRRLLVASTVLIVAVTASRTVCLSFVRWARRTGRVGHRTLILGAGRVGARLASVLQEHREYGLRPIGFSDATPLLPQHGMPVPLLGAPTELAHTLVSHRINVVIVSFSAMREPEIVDVIRTCDRLRCEIFFVPRLFELQAVGRDIEDVWGLPLVRLRRSPYRTIAWRCKRTFDIAVSGLALLALSPVMLACALAVRLEGGGRDVLFRQERVGVGGRPFELLKFRSLRPADETESRTRWSVANEDRMGPVGRFLRKSSLDELPQLWNILRGDMTLVGPRPERPHFVDEFSRSTPRYMARHRVPAGLTGWAQVHGLRGDTSIEERAQFDNRYIENWSLWTDVKILVRTVAAVVRGSGS